MATKNNFTEAVYNSETNTANLYVGEFIQATLDFNNDTFELHAEVDNDTAKDYYESMVIEKESYEKDDYDVRAEQGLYGYGY